MKSLSSPRFILASKSPRRVELLDKIGASFLVVSSDLEEVRESGEQAEDYVSRLAIEKATAVLKKNPLPSLGADTVVVLDGQIIEKPIDAADASSMLKRLQGRSHLVISGVALVDENHSEVLVVKTEVIFRKLSDETIATYVQSGEPMDKAGAYAIQGAASSFVTKINGSYTNVVGLPLAEVTELLERWCLH